MTDRSHSDTEPPDSSAQGDQPDTCVTLLQEAWRQAGALQAEGIRVLPDSVPILFFGRAITARVATVGINPSYREFQERNGQRVSPSRFHLPPSRYQDGELSVPDALKVCQSLHWYFHRNPHENWFQWPEALLNGMGVSFKNGTAAHTDIESPLATQPNWSGLKPENQTRLAIDGRALWRRVLLQMPELRAIVGLGTDPSIVEAMGATFDDEIDLSPLQLHPIRLGTWTPGDRTLTVYWWEKPWGQPREFFWKDGKSLYPAVGRCLVRRRPWDGGGRGSLPKLPTRTSDHASAAPMQPTTAPDNVLVRVVNRLQTCLRSRTCVPAKIYGRLRRLAMTAGEKPGTVADNRAGAPSPSNPCQEQSAMDETHSDEQPLLKALDAHPGDRGILLTLLKLYDAQDRQRDIIDGIESFLLQETDGDTRAHLRLLEGCAAEKLHNYRRARDYYEQGLTEKCSTPVTRYFLRNNLGFCCNQLWDYRAAERWCREAIEVDDRIPNAWKNLGISLKAQDRWLAAAWAFVGALRSAPDYAPAWHELTALMLDHSELRERDPDLAHAFAKIWGARRRGTANQVAEGNVMDEIGEQLSEAGAPVYPSSRLLAAAFIQRFREEAEATTLGEPKNGWKGWTWARAHIVAEQEDGTPDDLHVAVHADTQRDAALRFVEAVLRDEPRLKIGHARTGRCKIILGDDARSKGLYLFEIDSDGKPRRTDPNDAEE